MSVTKELLIIRHAEVEAKWKGICYGSLDVKLSESGKAACNAVAGDVLRHIYPATIFHSGLSRTRYLAESIARLCGEDVHVLEDARIQERNYGDWQGLTWDAAYASDPEHFHHLIEKPNSYRPPGGESTSEMQHRVVEWLNEQPEHRYPIIAISHSGPIAAVAGHCLGLHPREWSPWIVKHLERIRLAERNTEKYWEVTKTPLSIRAEPT